MPELPEVETVVRTLEKLIKNEEIIDVKIYWDNIIVGDIDEFKNKLIGQHFNDFKRRGKYLLFKLDDYYLMSHLRMEGKYFVFDDAHSKDKHSHVIFSFKSGRQLHYNDTRKFGKMELLAGDLDIKNIKGLGPEPFDDDFNLAYVRSVASKFKGPIKQLILDQHFVAGVGNIYADEILFEMAIDPESPANKLSDEDFNNMIVATRKILTKAIADGGTTIRSYTSSLGVSGRFQLSLNVHQRVNEKCKRCGGIILKKTVKTRGTYYCKKCQKLKK